MRQKLPQEKQYIKKNHRHRIWKRIVGALSCVVVFSTTYALILPAVTQEQTTFCGLPEHIHQDSCYVQTTEPTIVRLLCSPEILGVHSHGAECTDAQGNLICGKADYIAHAHDSSCFNGDGTLMCVFPEKEQHIHTDACYAQPETDAHIHDANTCYTSQRGALLCQIPETEGHTHSGECYSAGTKLICTEEHAHTDTCYESVLTCQLSETQTHQHGDACYEWSRVLTCTVAEAEPVLICTQPLAQVHMHSESCFETVTGESLTCGLNEGENHTHSERCYGTWELNCGSEEHTHGLACFADLTADVETAADWERSVVGVELTKQWPEDFLAIANSQLGYTESAENYVVREDGITVRGYSRFGAWYGEPYADWDTAYVAFCLHFAGAANLEPDLEVPNSLDYAAWQKSLEEQGLYRSGENYAPIPGDLIFLNTEEARLVGIVTDIPETGYVKVILGNDQDAVRTKVLTLEDPDIAGYASVSELNFPGEAVLAEDVLPGTEAVTLMALAEPVYYCGLEAHTHSEDQNCYDQAGNLTCTQTVHAHTAECEEAPVYYCGLAEHTHSDSCASDCSITEHAHDAACMVAPVYYCGLENDPEHVHDASCLISPYKCGLEAHLHDDTCPEDCAIIEHVHTESCKEEPAYRCGKEQHRHEDGCYDENGNLACNQEEHTHTSDCLLIYYCGVVEEHTHSGCYDNFVYTCGLIGHTHFYLCTTKPQYCDEEHIHSSECYDADGKLTCTEHTHILSCWINPASAGTGTDQEDLFAGSSRFHSSYFLKYQASGHTVSSYEVGTFALIPESANVDGWVPNTRQWSGASNANYLVAYCTDDRTSSSKKGEDYETYTLDTSRFSDDAQRRKVAAIIGHSYPFLTASEMREQLALAYEQGLTRDSSGNIIDIRDCTESDWMAASQWALWDTTSTYGTHPTDEVDIDDYGRDRAAAMPSQSERSCINPLTDPGHTDIATSRQHLEAIHNWLMSLQEPETLTVKAYDYEITETADGTYHLTVTVSLNRETVYGEHTVFQLSVGSKSTVISELEAGQSQFLIELDGITLEEIAGARVYLNVDGKHMQAYFFDSANYQDMVGGNWEYYSEDLSFDVTADKTEVTVYKKWTEGAPTDVASVTVQLYADGKPYGDPVELSDANSWAYTWKDLNKSHISGRKEDGTVFGGGDIVYTVAETPVPGFYSSLIQVEQFGNEPEEEEEITITYWKEVDTFDGEGEYVFLSQFGALTASYFKNEYYMNVSPIDLSVVSEEQAKTVWNVTGSDEEGYWIESKIYPGQYMNHSYWQVGFVSSSASRFHFADSKLFVKYANSTYYFRSFYSDGAQVYTTDADLAMSFRLYKLTTQTLPSSQINFLLTNTQVPTEAEVSVSVTKKWEGRRDDRYPLSAAVTLLQNGRAYGDPVTLNAANDWTYVWEKLPYSMNGEKITYSVQETPIPGYESSFEIQDNTNTDDPTLILTLTNTWKPTLISVEVRKADADDPAVLLPGARFDVYVVDSASEEAQQIPGTDLTGVKLPSIETPNNGKISMEFEVGETYYLIETKAPDGYHTLTEPVAVKATQTGLTVLSGGSWTLTEEGVLTIQNELGYVLPETGGFGTTPYTMAGLILTISAASLVYISGKRRRRDVSS